MQYLVQCTRTREQKTQASWFARVCTGSASINGIGPINRSEKKKRSEAVGNGRKHDQAKTCPTRIFFEIGISAQRRFFFECLKVSKGKRLETVGDRTFDRQKRHVSTQFSNIVQKHTLLWYPKP